MNRIEVILATSSALHTVESVAAHFAGAVVHDVRALLELLVKIGRVRQQGDAYLWAGL